MAANTRSVGRAIGYGDTCARETREKLRVVWVGSSAASEDFINKDENQFHQHEVFLLGGSFPYNWKSGIKRTLDKAASGQIGHLDRSDYYGEVGTPRDSRSVYRNLMKKRPAILPALKL
ncbi:hypothetical protein POM88_016103 [Heracleum sosnowskyi]|uniref:Uncharacterized protein n=1 Tax=Heracleum sosnowskyi TaxID=360622 RepID=A0AAD8IPY2_9APIA|nr:hypothetical protein POM88_016103 [Heracleum sosnowskyi]